MKRYYRPRGGKFHLLLNLLFYIVLFILIGSLILPYTSFFYRKPLFMPFFQRLNASDIILVKGEHFKLYVFGLNKRVSYTTSDFKVVDISLTGNIKAERVGTAVVKVKTKTRVVKCRVRVVDLSDHFITIRKGQRKKLKVKGNIHSVRWKSKDSHIAKVNRFGKVTAVSNGTTIITAKVNKKSLKCKIKVTDP